MDYAEFCFECGEPIKPYYCPEETEEVIYCLECWAGLPEEEPDWPSESWIEYCEDWDLGEAVTLDDMEGPGTGEDY